MKVTTNLLNAALLLAAQTQHVIAHPSPLTNIQLVPEQAPRAADVFVDGEVLVKRKGGGGGGGKGGGGGSSSGKGGGSGGSGAWFGGSSRSGSEGRSGSGGSSTSGGRSGGRGADRDTSSANKPSSSGGRGSPSSNSGGATRTGSGSPPAYGGGRYYGGGATTPYSAGGRSPIGGIAPVLFLGTALAFWPGIWLYGAYQYPYTHPYTFHNRTATNSTTTPTRDVLEYIDIAVRQSTTDQGVNQTKPVSCFCAQYSECGCDDDGNTTFLDSVIGDGTYANLNQSVVTVADVNGTSTILLNGTLENGTTASGGTDDAYSSAGQTVVEMSGYWLMVALVGATVYCV